MKTEKEPTLGDYRRPGATLPPIVHRTPNPKPQLLQGVVDSCILRSFPYTEDLLRRCDRCWLSLREASCTSPLPHFKVSGSDSISPSVGQRWNIQKTGLYSAVQRLNRSLDRHKFLRCTGYIQSCTTQLNWTAIGRLVHRSYPLALRISLQPSIFSSTIFSSAFTAAKMLCRSSSVKTSCRNHDWMQL